MGTPKVLDLFTGCGGLSLGFKQEGFQIIAAVDKWQVARAPPLKLNKQCCYFLTYL